MRSRPEARRKNAGRLLRTTRAQAREARAAPSDPQDRRLRPGGCRASGLLGTTQRVESGRTHGRRGTATPPEAGVWRPSAAPGSSPHLRFRLRRRVRHGPPARRVINEPPNIAAGLIDLVAVLDPPPPRRLTVARGTPRAQPVPHPPVQAELGPLLVLPAFPAGLHCFPRSSPKRQSGHEECSLTESNASWKTCPRYCYAVQTGLEVRPERRNRKEAGWLTMSKWRTAGSTRARTRR